MSIVWLETESDEFPPLSEAMDEPNGLLAASDKLGNSRLLAAYRQGIFPWYEAGQPVLWWSPDPRMVLWPDRMLISRSLAKLIRQQRYAISLDTAFAQVIRHCARARRKSRGTWITPEMQQAYSELHDQGYAHSVEVTREGKLVGGLYGVALGKVFYGESMFSLENNTSKLALAYLSRQLHRWNFTLIDCQVSSPHLLSLGAMEISRQEFASRLQQNQKNESRIGKWQLQSDLFS